MCFKPYEGKEAYIFVSYSHKDYQIILPILKVLDNKGYRIWYDKGIEWGSEWPDTIAKHLSNSTICMAFHSKTSVQSVNCRQEIYYAIKQKKSILSVYLDDVNLCEGLDMQLSPIQSLALFKYKDYTDFYKLIENTKVLQRCCNSSEGNEILDGHVVSVSDWNIDHALDKQFKKVFAEERKETFLERKIGEIKARNFMQELEDKVKSKEQLEDDVKVSFHEFLLLPNTYNEDDIKGKHFTIPNRTGVKTIIFEVYVLIDYKTMKDYYTCELLESIEDKDDTSNTIFFVEDPAPDGNRLILLHFDTMNNEVYINMGVLLGNSLRITRKPTPFTMQHMRLSDKLSLSDAAYDIEKLSNEEKENLLGSSETYGSGSVWYEANISECSSIIIDPETVEPIRREVFYDDKIKQWRARIKIEPLKSYFVFEICSKDSDERYEAIATIKKAYYYRNGSYGFPKDLMKAISYYEEDGSSEAFYEIAQIFATEKTMYDEESYFEYLKKAALLGYEKAEVELFMLSIEKYDDKERKEQFNILLDKVSGEKSTIGNFISGYFLEKGIISKENTALAFERYYQAACNGFNPALIRLHCEKSMWCEELKDKNSLYDNFVSSEFNGDAEYCFGCTLFFGYNILPNKKDGIKYLHLAADMKNKQAIYTLYKIYDLDEEYGNKKEVLKWLKVIEEFDDSVQINLANRLLKGIGCECCKENDVWAFNLFQKALVTGDKTAICNFLACLYEECCFDRDYGNPKDLFEEIVYPIPFFYLGYMYAKGLGVSKNIKKALVYYESAVNIGDKEAMYELYSLYDSDTEYENKEKALKWLKAIAKIDDSYQVKLANWLIDGIGCECCERNDKQAFDILQKASQSGNKTAIHNLAWLYKKGRGCDIDYKKAEELFKKASIKNSFYFLGDIYENGLGVTKNMEKALEYYKLGAERGSQIAIKHLKEMKSEK